MNTKKFLLAFLVVFVLLEGTGYIIHTAILGSTYRDEIISQAFRPEAEMMAKMWIVWLTDLIWSFFFVFLFVKGYENKGLMEGLRFGFYIGIFVSLVFSYQMYAFIPIPYSLVFQWFIYGMIQCLILGAAAALIYKPGTTKAPQQESA
jgi:magnesium-transporting ATPase (P-type)